jgi:transcriptional regulator with PAS, ATPase and Fis domain
LSIRDDIERARGLLAQGRLAEAEEVAASAAERASAGDEEQRTWLPEALTTRGAALARLNQHVRARVELERAIEAALLADESAAAGSALLTLMEELHAHLPEDELRRLYHRADELLSSSNDLETLRRLRACARRLFDARLKRDSHQPATRFVYAMEETGALLRRALRVAVTNSTVLITGETGTGKEVLARLIHEWSGRAGQFVAINCRSTLTEPLTESLLFGHVKGSFKDALQHQRGAVREAAGGTLFLDEIAGLSKANQGKLLRLIERGEIHSIGASTPERVQLRIIAATGLNLKAEVEAGRFRDDLFYRLQTFQLVIPPLRERPDDITAIARHFIEEGCVRQGKQVPFSPESLEALRRLPLHGNARELRALLERVLLAARDGATVSAKEVEGAALLMARQPEAAHDWEGCSLEEEVLNYEKGLIRLALDAADGKVTQAAHLLGITHQLLSFILNTRHKDLLEARTPARARRRRSIIHRSPDKPSK